MAQGVLRHLVVHLGAGELADDPAPTWASFSAGSKTGALRADQLPSTHPIAADIVDLEAVSTNFDQITYGKGASVLAQLVAFVGREAFLEGVRAYFAEHAFGNTSLADLLAALEPPSGRDLQAWSERWLETAGVNTLALEVETDADDLLTAVAVVQSATDEHPTLRPHRIGVGAYDLVDGLLTRTGGVELDVDGPRTSARARRPAPPGAAAAERRRPDLRQGPPGRAFDGPRPSSTCRRRRLARPCGGVGVRCGTLPADAEMAPRIRRAVCENIAVETCSPRLSDRAAPAGHDGAGLRPPP